MLVLILIVLSMASLVTGVVIDEMVLVDIAFGLSVVGLAVVVFGWWRRRRSARSADAAESAESVESVESAESVESEVDDEVEPEPEVEEPALVVVLPGRRRYHTPECEKVAEVESEELTLDEARDEGFSACSLCHPEPVAALSV
ncbi:hypothetical protein FPZ12_033225 [Amycolatopsis acidicola]|uniref:Uncharacterized protein n=1 Tax=Amycolatopsis acidicola TaxID=2596893 RepID=A0A5N0UUV7_9PSEU|nr:hypothetical protein [Amycolatopsis acidicola]KAA9153987.1 hypothetical protein FPZ12_033225 [Amycolatopsis acidicola]